MCDRSASPDSQGVAPDIIDEISADPECLYELCSIISEWIYGIYPKVFCVEIGYSVSKLNDTKGGHFEFEWASSSKTRQRKALLEECASESDDTIPNWVAAGIKRGDLFQTFVDKHGLCEYQARNLSCLSEYSSSIHSEFVVDVVDAGPEDRVIVDPVRHVSVSEFLPANKHEGWVQSFLAEVLLVEAKGGDTSISLQTFSSTASANGHGRVSDVQRIAGLLYIWSNDGGDDSESKITEENEIRLHNLVSDYVLKRMTLVLEDLANKAQGKARYEQVRNAHISNLSINILEQMKNLERETSRMSSYVSNNGQVVEDFLYRDLPRYFNDEFGSINEDVPRLEKMSPPCYSLHEEAKWTLSHVILALWKLVNPDIPAMLDLENSPPKSGGELIMVWDMVLAHTPSHASLMQRFAKKHLTTAIIQSRFDSNAPGSLNGNACNNLAFILKVASKGRRTDADGTSHFSWPIGILYLMGVDPDESNINPARIFEIDGAYSQGLIVFLIWAAAEKDDWNICACLSGSRISLRMDIEKGGRSTTIYQALINRLQPFNFSSGAVVNLEEALSPGSGNTINHLLKLVMPCVGNCEFIIADKEVSFTCDKYTMSLGFPEAGSFSVTTSWEINSEAPETTVKSSMARNLLEE